MTRRTAQTEPPKRTSLDKFWDSLTDKEKKAWPGELKKMMKEPAVFPGYKRKPKEK